MLPSIRSFCSHLSERFYLPDNLPAGELYLFTHSKNNCIMKKHVWQNLLSLIKFLPPPSRRLTKFYLPALLSTVVLVYACRKDFQQDAAPALENSEQPAERSTTAEIEMFVDSIPDTFINRQQRVLALMTYEEIKRRHPAVSGYGQPVWLATYSSAFPEDGIFVNMTPFVTYQDSTADIRAVLIVETTDTECKYWILPAGDADSLQRASDREDEVASDFNTCMQDCLCPSPVHNPHLWEYIRCWFACRFGGNGGSGNGTGNGVGNGSNTGGEKYASTYFGTVALTGIIPVFGFINQGTGNGTGNGNNGGGGNSNPNLFNYNFTQTAYDVYDKYFDCLAANPDISTAVYNKLYTPNGTMHCLSPFIDEALGMLCEEAQGVYPAESGLRKTIIARQYEI